MGLKKFLIPVAGCMVGLLWVMAGPARLFSSPNGREDDHPIVIAVVKAMGHQEYDWAVEGFREILEKEKITAKLEMIDRDDRNVTARIKALKPALILTMGSSATRSIADEIKEIPIIFSIVIDPRGSGITSRNIIGAAVDIPVKMQLETLKSAFPGLKRLGVVYNPPENEALVQEARTAATALGFTLNAYPVESETKIPEIGKLPIDIFWFIPDTLVCKPVIIKRIILSCLQNHMAVMGFTHYYARGGALLAVACDYEDIGRQSAEMAVKLLKGEKYSCLSITAPRKVKLYLNKITADRLGITIPGEIIQKASEIFGQ